MLAWGTMAPRLVWLLVAVGTGLAPVAARADLIYQLEPLVGVGATDNAAVTTAGEARVADSYTFVGGNTRLAYSNARLTLGLGYNGAYTQYVRTQGAATFTNNLALTSTAELSARWKLGMGAQGTLTKASGLSLVDPVAATTQAAVAGSLLYLSTGVNQNLSYQPTPRQGYNELASVTQVRYLESPTLNGMVVPQPTTTFIAAGVSGNREMGRNQYTLVLDGGDSFREADPALPPDPYAEGHTIIARLMAGWRRELSPTWTTTLQGGPSTIFKLDGSGVLAPAFNGMVNYTRLPWFASVSLAQSPAPNLFLGEATLNDQVIVRLALPLTRSERLFVGGWGGYTYARVASESQHLARLYDQFVGGAALTGRISNWPMSFAVSYLALSQRGSATPNNPVPDLARQTVFLSVRGVFGWGPGAAPMFGGVM